jgi:hypothetical protein
MARAVLPSRIAVAGVALRQGLSAPSGVPMRMVVSRLAARMTKVTLADRDQRLDLGPQLVIRSRTWTALHDSPILR